MAVCGLPAALEGLVPEGGAAPRLPSTQGPPGPLTPSGHRVLGSRWPLPQMTKLRPAEARGLQVAGGGGRGARGRGGFRFCFNLPVFSAFSSQEHLLLYFRKCLRGYQHKGNKPFVPLLCVSVLKRKRQS